jgi:hypothetical protein
MQQTWRTDMAELHASGIYGNYEPYLAQLSNPAVGGQFNPAVFGPAGSGGIGAGYGSHGAGAAPYAAFGQLNPWAAQHLSQLNMPLPQQQVLHPVQSAVQAAQQIAARQAVNAIQCAQALQQIVQHLAAQQFAQPAIGWQPQIGQGMGGAFTAGQIGQVVPQPYGWGGQTAMNPVPQQQAMAQLAPYLAAQQPEQFRQGWVH